MANWLAKAIVFGMDDAKSEAIQLIRMMAESGLPPRPKPVPNAGMLKEIAELYCERNMHPRAWELLQKYAGIVGAEEAQRLEDQYRKQWLVLMVDYFGDSKKCVLFGQDATTTEDRLRITVPPPCRKEALAEAARKVKELIKQGQ